MYSRQKGSDSSSLLGQLMKKEQENQWIITWQEMYSDTKFCIITYSEKGLYWLTNVYRQMSGTSTGNWYVSVYM